MPPGPNVLQQAGAKPSAEPRGAPLWNDRFFTGLVTQRNILRDPSGVVQERWYGGRPDALLDGLNIELNNRLTLARAPGSTKFSTATLPQGANSFYSFKQFTGSTETITVMADTPAVLYSINPTSKTTVLTKAAGAGPAFMIGVNSTLYIGDGVEQQAWTPIGGLRNWGISAPSGGSTLNEYAGLGADGGGTVAWSNPTHVEGSPDASYATVVPVAGAGFDNRLLATDYGFAPSFLPPAGVTGIGVKIHCHASDTTSIQVGAELIVVGSGYSFGFGAVVNSTSDIDIVLGGPGNLWMYPWLPGLIANSGFGVSIQGASTLALATLSVDSAEIFIYQEGAPGVNPSGSGSLATVNGGWNYLYEYANGVAGSFSPASPQSGATGNFTGKAYVDVTVVASADPQVTGIYVYRTKDGGSTFYALPSNPYPNSSATIQDSNLDPSLELLELADLNGLNTPPPIGFSAFEFHMSRIWGVVGNTVYYSSGPDLGLIQGNGYEGVPPVNFFTFPSQVVKLRSLGTVDNAVLIVYTTSDVYLILGNGSATGAAAGVGITVFYAVPFLRRLGLLNYWAEDARGSIVYMMTNDGRLVSFNPSSQIVYLDPEKSINEIGFPIGDQPPATSITLLGGSLAGFNPAKTYVSWHGSGSADQALYVSDGATGWFRCNPNQQPDGGAVWSTKRNIVGGCQAVQSIETAPGVFQLLIGPSGSTTLNPPRTLAGAAGSGSLSAGTYYVVCTTVDGSGNESLPTPEISVVVPANGSIVLTFLSGDYRAADIRVYFGTTPGGETHYFVSSSLTTFTVSTTAGQLSGTPPVAASVFAGGSVLYRDPTVWSDSGTPYLYCKARIGGNILAQPGQTASVSFITADFAAQGSQPTLSVLFDELDAAFTALSVSTQDPPHLAAPASVYANRYYTRQATSGTAIASVCRYMQMWVDFGSTDTVQNEMLSLTPFGTYEQEA